MARWDFHVKCMHCGERQEKAVYIEKGAVKEVPGSRGEAHLVMKCKVGSSVERVCIALTVVTVLRASVHH